MSEDLKFREMAELLGCENSKAAFEENKKALERAKKLLKKRGYKASDFFDVRKDEK